MSGSGEPERVGKKEPLSNLPERQEHSEKTISALFEQLEAAGGLIESLEAEVATLRADLKDADDALRAAREEVEARGEALAELEVRASEADALRNEMTSLRQTYAEQEITLRNEHINELAELRRTLEEQRRADVAAASADERFEALKEELDRERAALEERHRADMEALEASSKQWEERLREGYREQEERHRRELDALVLEHEREKQEIEARLRTSYEERLNTERTSANERQETTIAALNSAAEGRAAELERDYRQVIEDQQAEIESLRVEIEERTRSAEESRREAAREVKKLAEGRERDLKRAHSARLAEAEREAERKLAALKAQRDADNKALSARHAEEVARLRREYEERLLAEDERRRQETWALEEKLQDLRIQRDAEMQTYGARLEELQAALRIQETNSERDLRRVVSGFESGLSAVRDRISALEDALAESESARERIARDAQELSDKSRLERISARREPSALEAARSGVNGAGGPDGPTDEERRLRELDASRILAEERAESLEKRLRSVEQENRRVTEELERARRDLAKLADPERRLRDGITLFNRSEHARAVASISKALGLPKVHSRIGDDAAGKPVFTFVWDEMAWRRYVSDPTEGVEEPRVYLSGTGDDPEELPPTERRPNSRMDSQGRLTLGIQAR